MSHTEPGKRRDAGGGLGTLDAERPADAQVPPGDAQVPREDGRVPREDGRVPSGDSRVPSGDSRVPSEEAPVSGPAGEEEQFDANGAASEGNNKEAAERALTVADLVERIERCSPRWPRGSVLVAGIMGFRVMRTTSPEDAGLPPTPGNGDPAAADGHVHAVWMPLA
jgi:hypothetical protein